MPGQKNKLPTWNTEDQKKLDKLSEAIAEMNSHPIAPGGWLFVLGLGFAVPGILILVFTLNPGVIAIGIACLIVGAMCMVTDTGMALSHYLNKKNGVSLHTEKLILMILIN